MFSIGRHVRDFGGVDLIIFNPCHPSSHEEDEGLRYSNWAALPIMDFNGVFAGKGA